MCSYRIKGSNNTYVLSNMVLAATHFLNKDEQIIKLLNAPTLSQDSDVGKRSRILEIKEEIVAECSNSILDQLQGEFVHVPSSSENHQWTKQTLRSIQTKQKEFEVSQVMLVSRMDQIGEEADLLKDDLLLIKNDVNSEWVNSVKKFT